MFPRQLTSDFIYEVCKAVTLIDAALYVQRAARVDGATLYQPFGNELRCRCIGQLFIATQVTDQPYLEVKEVGVTRGA